MKVILQEDVKNVGKVGQLINVASGFARNYLFPKKLAMLATEKKVNEWNHLQRVAEAKKKKAIGQRQELVNQLKSVTLKFEMESASDSEKIFGSITNMDISDRLEAEGFQVDKRDIHLEEPIRVLGQHKALIKLGEGLEAEVTIAVDKKA
ncbi:MAG: 50S ribosomal protein L9 [Bdellovibrionaceae bacterium]|nr:50S ribosomal protein L9 [Pseudobdellovibrionaceae bacterium]|tara:strand:- start:1239 stop:1688 length:450 start_codon:yes stop_codon:yes gene_type:complete